MNTYKSKLETIKSALNNENIKVVSFDIFDTLLVRPAINPKDIFWLLQEKIKKDYKVDFLKFRYNAEEQSGLKNATIHDIYNFIALKYALKPDLAENLKDEEIKIERQLLQPRQDFLCIYNEAVRLGKKIIAVSDMYLPGNILADILRTRGFSDISNVYVSCDYQARKDDGTLYDIVLDKEKICPSQIIHIGDNYRSDCCKALEKGIAAFCVPSVKNIILSQDNIYQKIYGKQVSNDPLTRILIGFTFNNFVLSCLEKKTDSVFENLKEFSELALSPVLFYIAQKIAFDDEIQKYGSIYFASRDGYLPLKAYKLLSQQYGLAEGSYLYCGRRAYGILQYDDFFEYLQKVSVSSEYTLENAIKCYVKNEEFSQKILAFLSPEEKEMSFDKQRGDCIKVLRHFSEKLNQIFEDEKEKVRGYYNQEIKTISDRIVVFDVGYGGSVSQAINRARNIKTDKVYLSETKKNRKQDKKNKTKTFTLIQDNFGLSGLYLLFEELFSPAEGGCIGFKKQGDRYIPEIESIQISQAMENDLGKIQKTTLKYHQKAISTFGEYLPFLKVNDLKALINVFLYAFKLSKHCEADLFKNIIFPDPSFRKEDIPLSEKINFDNSYRDVFSCTGFDNPKNQLVPCAKNKKTSLKIGLHIHFYYIDVYDELLEYLKAFPYQFDLIVTTCSRQNVSAIENLFNHQTIKKLNKIRVEVVSNRGRDVAPWLLYTANEQKNYDLFAHIHTKKSEYYKWGDLWRQYLYKNLLDAEVVKTICESFETDNNLGLVFPNVFLPLKNVCIVNEVTQEGEFGEKERIKGLLQQLGKQTYLSRSSVLFSEGTMFWYRPKALSPLFELNLKLEDFEEEPIKRGGSLAHVIERMPAIICRTQGYEAKVYTPYTFVEMVKGFPPLKSGHKSFYKAKSMFYKAIRLLRLISKENYKIKKRKIKSHLRMLEFDTMTM